LRIPERENVSFALRQSCIAGQEEAAKKLELCIAQNELKQGLLLNCNFVNAVNALELKMSGAQNENVPAEII
jgi:hypothetical protein